MRLIVDSAALADLNDIAAWIAQDQPAAARRVLIAILSTIEQLQYFPGLARPGRAGQTWERVVPHTPYIVVFEFTKNPTAIIVIAVVHGARDR
jgi:toxin ParE1/3/4